MIDTIDSMFGLPVVIVFFFKKDGFATYSRVNCGDLIPGWNSGQQEASASDSSTA